MFLVLLNSTRNEVVLLNSTSSEVVLLNSTRNEVVLLRSTRDTAALLKLLGSGLRHRCHPLYLRISYATLTFSHLIFLVLGDTQEACITSSCKIRYLSMLKHFVEVVLHS